MGCVYTRGNTLWIKFKDEDGKWQWKSTRLKLGQRRQAQRILKRIEEKVEAAIEFRDGKPGRLRKPRLGPVTVSGFANRWIMKRKNLGLADWKNDDSRLKHHVLPRIGEMPIADVRPRHLAQLFEQLRTKKKRLAPKTIYNIYSVLKALFRDAHLEDLIHATPCILNKYQLGENEDKDPEWRSTAIYSRDELEIFLFDARIPWDRQVLYALQGLGALRHGEAAGLRWGETLRARNEAPGTAHSGHQLQQGTH